MQRSSLTEVTEEFSEDYLSRLLTKYVRRAGEKIYRYTGSENEISAIDYVLKYQANDSINSDMRRISLYLMRCTLDKGGFFVDRMYTGDQRLISVDDAWDCLHILSQNAPEFIKELESSRKSMPYYAKKIAVMQQMRSVFIDQIFQKHGVQLVPDAHGISQKQKVELIPDVISIVAGYNSNNSNDVFLDLYLATSDEKKEEYAVFKKLKTLNSKQIESKFRSIYKYSSCDEAEIIVLVTRIMIAIKVTNYHNRPDNLVLSFDSLLDYFISIIEHPKNNLSYHDEVSFLRGLCESFPHPDVFSEKIRRLKGNHDISSDIRSINIFGAEQGRSRWINLDEHLYLPESFDSYYQKKYDDQWIIIAAAKNPMDQMLLSKLAAIISTEKSNLPPEENSAKSIIPLILLGIGLLAAGAILFGLLIQTEVAVFLVTLGALSLILAGVIKLTAASPANSTYEALNNFYNMITSGQFDGYSNWLKLRSASSRSLKVIQQQPNQPEQEKEVKIFNVNSTVSTQGMFGSNERQLSQPGHSTNNDNTPTLNGLKYG